MSLPWKIISSVEELETIWNSNTETKNVFFKHSTRCSISTMALNRFERSWNPNDAYTFYFIDLLKTRDVSNRLSELSGVFHKSPQVIVSLNKAVLYHASHSEIYITEIQKL